MLVKVPRSFAEKGWVDNECVFEQKGCWAWLTLRAVHVGGGDGEMLTVNWPGASCPDGNFLTNPCVSISWRRGGLCSSSVSPSGENNRFTGTSQKKQGKPPPSLHCTRFIFVISHQFIFRSSYRRNWGRNNKFHSFPLTLTLTLTPMGFPGGSG